MRIAQVKIEHFRGIANAVVNIPNHCALLGDNNVGKSTLLEAIDLVLGPERLYRRPPINEHDFFAGEYLPVEGSDPPKITSEVVLVDLSDDLARHFSDHLEWWCVLDQKLIDSPPPEQTDSANAIPALRVFFEGVYDPEEDDFVGTTFFRSPVVDDGTLSTFKTQDKRLCGFLFLRTLRTGRRALSLERGSLLDVILRLQEKRLKMWEDVLGALRELPVAADPDVGLSEVLTEVQESVRRYVPIEWGEEPHMRVSQLTREDLRSTLSVFLSTGAKAGDGRNHAAPFEYQGTGTINTLVLALLTLIADLKQNVIFAMEEPEIAVPPHTQRQIVANIKKMSSQSIFTSHSPYVLSELDPDQLVILEKSEGELKGVIGELPPAVKAKKYKEDLKRRFCEALLSRRVLLVEGRTEYDAFPAAAHRLAELEPSNHSRFEASGVAILDAETDSQIEQLGAYFSSIGKTVFAIYDKQKDEAASKAIQTAIPNSFESPEDGFESLLVNQTAEAALRRFAEVLIEEGWPTHFDDKKPVPGCDLALLKDAIYQYLCWSKGRSTAAELLTLCTKEEMPEYVVNTVATIHELSNPSDQ